MNIFLNYILDILDNILNIYFAFNELGLFFLIQLRFKYTALFDDDPFLLHYSKSDIIFQFVNGLCQKFI